MSKNKKPSYKLRKVIFKTDLSPGDILMLSAAVRDLKKAHSDILVDVHTNIPALWENNIYLTKLSEDDKEAEVIDVQYTLIQTANTVPYHFIHGYRKFIEDALDIRIPPTVFRGEIFLSDQEKSWASRVQELGIEENFWLLFSGGKWDYTTKWMNPDIIQKVVDHFKDKILFVQCGQADHHHPKLDNVLNLIGETDTRQLIRLMYHAAGSLSPVTFAMHLAAAVETKRTMPPHRACVVINGGREPTQWEMYPNHRFLTLTGALDCCELGGCWKSRAFPLGDGDEKDKSLCKYPEDSNRKGTYNYDLYPELKGKEFDIKVPKCINMITHKDIIRAIETYYEGGSLEYGGGFDAVADIVRENEAKDQKAQGDEGEMVII